MTKDEFIKQLEKERDAVRCKVQTLTADLERITKELEYWKAQETAINATYVRYAFVEDSDLAK